MNYWLVHLLDRFTLTINNYIKKQIDDFIHHYIRTY